MVINLVNKIIIRLVNSSIFFVLTISSILLLAYFIHSYYNPINPIFLNNPTYVIEWNKEWSGNYSDSPYDIKIDSEDNIYIVGSTRSYGAGSNDIILVKYDSKGYQIWNQTWGGTNYEFPAELQIDSNGNIYVVGSTEPTNQKYDIFLLKFNNQGVFEWSRIWTSMYDDYGRGIAIDSLNNVYVLGELNGELTIIYLNSSGSQKWLKKWATEEFRSPKGIVLDKDNNFYVVTNRYSDIFLTKFNSTGDMKWNTQWHANKQEYGRNIAIDSLNNLYVVGYNQSESNKNDLLLIKFNSDGQQVWNMTWGGTESEDGFDLQLDSLNNIHITGSTYSYGLFKKNLIYLSISDSGNLITNVTWGLDERNEGRGITFDSLNNTYIVAKTFNGDNDMNILKYLIDSDGDSIADILEKENFTTNPNDSDTDGDGLSDWEEINIYFTDPNQKDTDLDGINDLLEISWISNPRNALLNPFITLVMSLIVINSIYAIFIGDLIKNLKLEKKKGEIEFNKIENLEGLIKDDLSHLSEKIKQEFKSEMLNYENSRYSRDYGYHDSYDYYDIKEFEKYPLKTYEKRFKSQTHDFKKTLQKHGFKFNYYLNNQIKKAYLNLLESSSLKNDLKKFFKSELCNAGFSNFNKKTYSFAAKYFEIALQIDASDISILNDIGICYYKNNLFRKAIKKFKKALKNNPNNLLAMINLAVVYFKKEKKEIGFEYYKKALELNPKINQSEFDSELISSLKDDYNGSIEYYHQQFESKSIKKPKISKEEEIADKYITFYNKLNLLLESLIRKTSSINKKITRLDKLKLNHLIKYCFNNLDNFEIKNTLNKLRFTIDTEIKLKRLIINKVLNVYRDVKVEIKERNKEEIEKFIDKTYQNGCFKLYTYLKNSQINNIGDGFNLRKSFAVDLKEIKEHIPSLSNNDLEIIINNDLFNEKVFIQYIAPETFLEPDPEKIVNLKHLLKFVKDSMKKKPEGTDIQYKVIGTIINFKHINSPDKNKQFKAIHKVKRLIQQMDNQHLLNKHLFFVNKDSFTVGKVKMLRSMLIRSITFLSSGFIKLLFWILLGATGFFTIFWVFEYFF